VKPRSAPIIPTPQASASNLASLYQAEGCAAAPLVARMISLALSIPKQPSALDDGPATSRAQTRCGA